VGLGLAVTALALGLRHGLDWDHLAAIADLSGTQQSRRRAFVLATLYIAGHGLVVLLLGIAAIVFAGYVPASVDAAMVRVVGATLVALGLWVLWSLVRERRHFQLRSRATLVASAARRVAGGWRRRTERQIVVIEHEHSHLADEVHEHDLQTAHASVGAVAPAGAPGTPERAARHRHRHRHVVPMPDDPLATSGGTAFGVGAVHGIGAETPTQVVIFLTAANAGGDVVGVQLLACFLAGLVASNTLLALVAVAGLIDASKRFPVYVTVSVAVALFSLGVGSALLLGRDDLLPSVFAA
jgi:hypothetical protein